VEEELPNNGRYQWTVPNVNSENCYLKITVTTSGESYSQVTQAPFTIIGFPTYTITALPNNPEFGNVEGAGEYDQGEEVNLTATPNSGYYFREWIEDEETVMDGDEPAGQNYTFYASEDRDLIAVFELETYSLTFAVKDQTAEPIEEAIITLNGHQNDAGAYVFDHIEPGEYDYLVTADGYFDATGSVTVTDQDKTIEVILDVDDTQIASPAFEGLKVYPNPARDKLYVNFYNHKPVVVEVLLINMHNQTIKSVTNSGKGQQQLFFDVEGLSSGLYLLQISFDGFVHQKKIMIKPL